MSVRNEESIMALRRLCDKYEKKDECGKMEYMLNGKVISAEDLKAYLYPEENKMGNRVPPLESDPFEHLQNQCCATSFIDCSETIKDIKDLSGTLDKSLRISAEKATEAFNTFGEAFGSAYPSKYIRKNILIDLKEDNYEKEYKKEYKEETKYYHLSPFAVAFIAIEITVGVLCLVKDGWLLKQFVLWMEYMK